MSGVFEFSFAWKRLRRGNCGIYKKCSYALAASGQMQYDYKQTNPHHIECFADLRQRHTWRPTGTLSTFDLDVSLRYY